MRADQWYLAEENFNSVRRKARRSRFMSFLRRRTDNLLSFEDVKKITAPTGESYIGCKSVQVERIVGSEGRNQDYNGSFCPRREFMRHRWCKVDLAFYEGTDLPAVQLLELGGVFFVRDGNHRVSAARTHGITYIDAEVIRLDADIELLPNMTMSDIEQRASGGRVAV
jgi:hypothetical protein